ncbi:Coronin-like protein crn1 [Mortierella sp. GBA43]|nr:Coronin-like protein crn1 [Mortierella sp. GBA43]
MILLQGSSIRHKEIGFVLQVMTGHNLLASGSSDRTVRIWDAATGESQSMIQDFNGAIYGVDFDGKHLVTGCRDGSVLKWEVSQGEEDHPLHVRLCWVVTGGSLMTQGTSMEGTRGLSVLNTKLLKQRGAIGEPESVMGSMNKIVRMVSVVSKLGQLAADEDEPGPESTSTRTSRSVRTTGTMK